MTASPPTPKLWFYGRFAPPPSTPFHVPRAVSIAGRFAINLMADAFWITLAEPPAENFETTMDEIEHLASTFAGAYALKTGAGMRPFVESWIESQSAVHPTTLGVRRAEKLQPPAEAAIIAQALGAVDYAFRTSPAWVAALRDAGLATVDYSDDAFLYAARSLECCARAVGGRQGSVSAGDWDRLAQRMGVQADELASAKNPLVSARHAVAHGDSTDGHLVAARGDRDRLLDSARGLVRLAIQRSQTEALQRGEWQSLPAAES